MRSAVRSSIAPILTHERKSLVHFPPIQPKLGKNGHEMVLLESTACQLLVSNPLTLFPKQSHKTHSWDPCKNGSVRL